MILPNYLWVVCVGNINDKLWTHQYFIVISFNLEFTHDYDWLRTEIKPFLARVSYAIWLTIFIQTNAVELVWSFRVLRAALIQWQRLFRAALILGQRLLKVLHTWPPLNSEQSCRRNLSREQKKRSMEENYVDAPLVVRHLTSIARAVHLAQRGLLVILWSPWHGFLHTYASKCHGLPVETLPVLQNKRSDLKSIENVVIRGRFKIPLQIFSFSSSVNNCDF